MTRTEKHSKFFFKVADVYGYKPINCPLGESLLNNRDFESAGWRWFIIVVMGRSRNNKNVGGPAEGPRDGSLTWGPATKLLCGEADEVLPVSLTAGSMP